MKEFTSIYLSYRGDFDRYMDGMLAHDWGIVSSGYIQNTRDSDFDTSWAHFIREKKDGKES